MKKLLQFGAGNIGRSFIGQLFSAAGYEVIFADVDAKLIEAINNKRSYTVAIRDKSDYDIEVKNVSAISTLDRSAVVKAIEEADICGTAVGPNVLPKLFPVMAAGLVSRREKGKGPIDFILCENLRDAARIVRGGLKPLLPPDFPIEQYVGLSETSIGKMVPLVPEAKRSQDPLTVYAEAYNTLILDKKAFLNGVPSVPGLSPKDNMKAFVDRKSFVHNLGHAALAYYTYLVDPEKIFTYEAVEDMEIRSWVKKAMSEAGKWLIHKYPLEFNDTNIEDHINDLLDRFGNRSLGDTLHRVGRDLTRKLSAEDRVAGILRLCNSNGLDCTWIAGTLACGLFFVPPDNDKKPFMPDIEVVKKVKLDGPENFLKSISGLDGNLLENVIGLYIQILNSLNFQGRIERKKLVDIIKSR